MEKSTLNPEEAAEINPPSNHKPTSVHLLAGRIAGLLEQADALVYTIVGVCFIGAALIGLGYSFWDFASKLGELGNPDNKDSTGIVASAIIKLVSDLLLVIIILEVLGTIIAYLRSHVTSLTPFLYIGIISATRGILSIGAKLSVENVTGNEFTNAMIELGVNAVAILALGVTLRLLGKTFDK